MRLPIASPWEFSIICDHIYFGHVLHGVGKEVSSHTSLDSAEQGKVAPLWAWSFSQECEDLQCWHVLFQLPLAAETDIERRHEPVKCDHTICLFNRHSSVCPEAFSPLETIKGLSCTKI